MRASDPLASTRPRVGASPDSRDSARLQVRASTRIRIRGKSCTSAYSTCIDPELMIRFLI